MKKILTTAAVLILVIIFQLQPISAHELETSQTVGAVLHMNPQDDPIVGEQTGFFFEFKDKENKFEPEKCNCRFSIEESGIEIYSQNLFQNNSNPTLENASAYFAFPKKAIYKIKIVGEPIEDNEFNPFSIEYEVNVQREAVTPIKDEAESERRSTNKIFTYAVPMVIIAALVVFILMRRK